MDDNASALYPFVVAGGVRNTTGIEQTEEDLRVKGRHQRDISAAKYSDNVVIESEWDHSPNQIKGIAPGERPNFEGDNIMRTAMGPAALVALDSITEDRGDRDRI